MDRFGKEEFRQLLETPTAPAISIYMPIERREMTFKSLRLQFRAHIDGAAEKLEQVEDFKPEDYEPMLARLRELVDARWFFNRTGDGLAVFMAPGFEAIYFLPIQFENQMMVGDNFHTRPLLEHIAAPTDYWVLAVGEKEVSFWEGSPTGVEKVELENLPQSLQEALMLESEPGQEALNMRTGGTFSFRGPRARAGSSQGRRIPSPIFHGHGGGRDERESYLRQYFSQVGQGIGEYLGDAEGPVILAAVDYCHPLFKQSGGLKNLAEEGIVGNVHFRNEKEIYEKAWPIARRELDRRANAVLEEWERAFGRGSAEMDLSMVARRTVEGRVHRLLLDDEARMWGRFDRTTGEVTQMQEDAAGEDGEFSVDVFDEIAETVVQRGGEVVVLPSDRMPVDSAVGAILRGNGG